MQTVTKVLICKFAKGTLPAIFYKYIARFLQTSCMISLLFLWNFYEGSYDSEILSTMLEAVNDAP